MKKIARYCLFSCLLILFVRISFAQQDNLDIYDFDFSRLSKIKVISATKTPQEIGEIPSTVFVIPSTEIKEKGYFTLDEVLSDLPGFQFRDIMSINSYVFQRGIPNQNNLILLLIDGVQVNELNSGGFYGGGQYNLSNAERIEVVYGPASVAYGTNAVTGIINIVTKSALKEQLEINTLAGSFNTVSSDVTYCYKNEKNSFGVRFSGMLKKTGKADLAEEAGDNNWTGLMDNFENDYSFDLKIQSGNFILGTNFLQKQASAAAYMKSAGTIYKDYGTSWNIRFVNNYIKYNKQISERFAFTSVMYNRNATVLDNSVLYVVDTAQIGYFRPNNLTGFENILNYSSSHSVSATAGVTLEYEQLAKNFSITTSDSPEIKPPKPPKPGMEQNYLASVFFEPRVTLLKSLYVSGGLRFDQSSIYGQVLSPRAGVSYNVKNQIFKFSFSEAFRAPKPWDYTDGFGNNSLLPEKMKSFEASISLSFDKNFKFRLTGYKNKLENAIVKEIVGEGYRWVNEGELNTDGVEVSFRYLTKKFNSILNYTFNNSCNAAGQPVAEISKHCANASLTYSFSDHIKINLRANYVGERENLQIISSVNSKIIDPFLVFHGALTFLDFKGFNVQLIAKNLLNAEYYHTSNRTPGRYRQPQRTVMLSVGYSFKTN